MRGGRGVVILFASSLLAACASDPATAAISSATASAVTESTATTDPLETPTPTRAPANDTTEDLDTMDPTSSATQPTAPEPSPAATATPVPVTVDEPEPAPECVRLTDFTLDAENFGWFIVNDNVMGGRSSGGPTFENSVMMFEGTINTNGGGFSSVRAEVAPTTLAGYTHLVVRARTDERTYKVILEDALETRDRRISQQRDLVFGEPDAQGWQLARIDFDQLDPRIFGRAVSAEPFRPDLATQLGVMISDGIDGPFRIEIDWIDTCR